MDLEIKNNQAEFVTNTAGIESFVFRVFENGEDFLIYYASSRLDTISVLPDKIIIVVPDNYAGRDYEIKTLPSLHIISKGKLVSIEKKSEE